MKQKFSKFEFIIIYALSIFGCTVHSQEDPILSSTAKEPVNNEVVEAPSRKEQPRVWDQSGPSFCGLSEFVYPKLRFNINSHKDNNNFRPQEMIWTLQKKGGNEEVLKILKFDLDELLRHGAFKEEVNHGLPGSHKKSILLFENGVKAIFKPDDDQKILGATHAEVAADILDDLLGFGIVPMTVVREINGVVGSVQYFLQDTIIESNVELAEEFELIRIFDYLIDNPDRNRGNIVHTDDGLKAIDHELGFWANPNWAEGRSRKCGDAQTIRKLLSAFPLLQKKIDNVSLNEIDKSLLPFVSSRGRVTVIKRIKSLYQYSTAD